MSKNLENQKNDKKKTSNRDHYNEPVNKWLREYLIQINEQGHGNKENSDNEFAIKCGIKIDRIQQITTGSARVSIDDLKKISKAAEVTSDEIIFGKPVPDNLIVDDIDVLSQESYNILYKHTKGIFTARDKFLIFLDYLIQQEDFILELSRLCKDMLGKFKESKNLPKLADYKGYDDFKNKLTDKKLSKDLRDTITDSKVRDSVRELVTKYLYDNLKWKNPLKSDY